MTEAEQKAERDRVMAEIDALLDAAMPKPKPKPKLASENSLSLETQRERLAREQRRLMEAEKATLRRAKEEEASRMAALGELQRRNLRERQAEAARLSPADLAQSFIDAWVEGRQRAERHERWLRRTADPDGWGVYDVAPCHRD